MEARHLAGHNLIQAVRCCCCTACCSQCRSLLLGPSAQSWPCPSEGRFRVPPADAGAGRLCHFREREGNPIHAYVFGLIQQAWFYTKRRLYGRSAGGKRAFEQCSPQNFSALAIGKSACPGIHAPRGARSLEPESGVLPQPILFIRKRVSSSRPAHHWWQQWQQRQLEAFLRLDAVSSLSEHARNAPRNVCVCYLLFVFKHEFMCLIIW